MYLFSKQSTVFPLMHCSSLVANRKGYAGPLNAKYNHPPCVLYKAMSMLILKAISDCRRN